MRKRFDVLVLHVLAYAPSGGMRVTHLRDVGIDMRQIQRLAASGLVSFTGPHGDRVVTVTPDGHQRLSLSEPEVWRAGRLLEGSPTSPMT